MQKYALIQYRINISFNVVQITEKNSRNDVAVTMKLFDDEQRSFRGAFDKSWNKTNQFDNILFQVFFFFFYRLNLVWSFPNTSCHGIQAAFHQWNGRTQESFSILSKDRSFNVSFPLDLFAKMECKRLFEWTFEIKLMKVFDSVRRDRWETSFMSSKWYKWI